MKNVKRVTMNFKTHYIFSFYGISGKAHEILGVKLYLMHACIAL